MKSFPVDSKTQHSDKMQSPTDLHSAYRRIYWLRLIGLVQRSAATWRCMLHLSDELGELSQWQCTATMTAP